MEILHEAVERELLRPIDRHVALFLRRLAGGGSATQLLSAAMASKAVGEGHVCLPLREFAGQVLIPGEESGRAPEFEQWRRGLAEWQVVGGPGDDAPLILDAAGRLYLSRYFGYEHCIADNLMQRAAMSEEPDMAKAGELLRELFGDYDDREINYQQLAAAMVLFKRVVVISGGPGTGKTHTVARILALLGALGNGPARIGLAAPTGKAAARLGESIRKVGQELAPRFRENIPDKTQTLHRLLGMSPDAIEFRHHRENPLPLDLLVLDEASMIDVPLMAALLEALPAHARLIVLGDRDQLASVEAGSLFADLCGSRGGGWSPAFCDKLRVLGLRAPEPADDAAPFGDCVIMLQKSYRFRQTSGIGTLAQAVNSGQPDRVERVLAAGYGDLEIAPANEHPFKPWLRRHVAQGFAPCFRAGDANSALELYGRFRILCAQREGPRGVSGLNRGVEKLLRAEGLVQGDKRWYRGQPIMIHRNHYGLRLFNGDTGILWPDENNVLLAWFARPDGELMPVAPARLPEHETAYAVTIHKSQGSEFDRVLLLLPSEDVRVLSRELLYTAITRAKQQLILHGEPQLLLRAVRDRVIRHSGLTEKLWTGKP